MIIKNEREQWVGCSLCGDRIELSRTDATNPLTVLMHLQQMRIEHKPCEEYSLDPAMARLQRIYRVRMREELAAPRVDTPATLFGDECAKLLKDMA
jgi:hypothetical protein